MNNGNLLNPRQDANPKLNDDYELNSDQDILETAIELAQNAPLDVDDDPLEGTKRK